MSKDKNKLMDILNYQKDFYGNEIALKIIENTVNNNNLSHAYLIYGDDGLGKKTFAYRFAAAILCKGKGIKPCFECSSCNKLINNSHPDIKVVLGAEAKNSIHIQTVREIRSDCYIKPNESDKKIYIITNAQNMTISAYNAFLKTLEEPPEHAVFLLTANNIEALPQTIASRLTPIELFPISDNAVRECISKQHPELDDETISNITVMSKGNLGSALNRISDEKFSLLIKNTENLCESIISKKEYFILKSLNVYEKDRLSLIQMLSQFTDCLREVMLIKLKSSDIKSKNITRLASALTLKQTMDLIEFSQEVKLKLDTNVKMNLMIAYICGGIKKIID